MQPQAGGCLPRNTRCQRHGDEVQTHCLLFTATTHGHATVRATLPFVPRKHTGVGPPGGDLFQIRGQNGLLLSSVDPLPQVSSKQEVLDTAHHVLQTFYPVSPTIDLQKVHVYNEDVNCTGRERPANSSVGVALSESLSASRPIRFQR